MPVDKNQIAKAVRTSTHIADREAIAAFLLDADTGPAPNAFPETSAGAARHIWEGQSFEFRMIGVRSLGLSCLLKALSELPSDTKLVRTSFEAGPYKASVFQDGGGLHIVGAVLFGRPNMELPVLPQARVPEAVARRASARKVQLDLFAS